MFSSTKRYSPSQTLRLIVQLIAICSLLLTSLQPLNVVQANQNTQNPVFSKYESGGWQNILAEGIKSKSSLSDTLAVDLLNWPGTRLGSMLDDTIELKSPADSPSNRIKGSVLLLQTSLLRTSFDFANNDPQGWVWTIESGNAHGEVENEHLYMGGGGTWSKGNWRYSYEAGSNKTSSNARFMGTFHHHGNNFAKIGVVYRDGTESVYQQTSGGDYQIDIPLTANKEIAYLLFGTGNIYNDGSWIDNIVLEGVQSTRSEIRTDQDIAVANNADSIQVTVSARDSEGSVLVGHSVRIDVSGEGNTVIGPNPGITDENGEVSFAVISNHAETKILSAVDLTTNISFDVQKQVQFTAGPVDSNSSTIGVDRNEAPADGSTPVTVTVTALDAFGNPTQGITVTFSTDSQTAVITPTWEITDLNGQSFAMLTNNISEALNVSATVNGTPLANLAAVVFRKADLAVTKTSSAPTNDGISGSSATAGYPITYTIAVENQGQIDAPDVVVSDTLMGHGPKINVGNGKVILVITPEAGWLPKDTSFSPVMWEP